MDKKRQRRCDRETTIIPRPQTHNLHLPSQNGFYIFINPNDLLSRLPTDVQWNIVKYLSLQDISSLQQANKILRNAVGTARSIITNSLTDEDREQLPNWLHKSIIIGNLQAVENMLSMNKGLKRLDLNKVPVDYFTLPLFEAVEKGNLEIVKALVENGADPNKADDGETPLWIAAEKGRLDLVEYLVGKGANPDQADNGGRTPIWIAAQEGHLNVVRYLVGKGANPDQADNGGRTPIYVATHARHLDVVKYLVEEAKVDFNKATIDENWTPLDMANFDRKDKAIADYLRSKGADGWTQLLYACYEGDLNTTQQLIESGANVNEVNNKGETPIYVAAQKGHLDVVRYLFEGAKADPNKANKYGQTPLWTAAQEGHLDVVQYLVEKARADPNKASNEGRTPISIAKGFWHFDVANYLRSIGAQE